MQLSKLGKKESMYKDNNYAISIWLGSFHSGFLNEFSLCNHTSCVALSDSLFALFCSNWPFQFNLIVEKDFWNYWLHINSVKKSTCTKKKSPNLYFRVEKFVKQAVAHSWQMLMATQLISIAWLIRTSSCIIPTRPSSQQVLPFAGEEITAVMGARHWKKMCKENDMYI